MFITKVILICSGQQTAADNTKGFPSRFIVYRLLVSPASDIGVAVLGQHDSILQYGGRKQWEILQELAGQLPDGVAS
jgi:hypothetical protein